MSRRLLPLCLLLCAGGVHAQSPNCAGVPRTLPAAQDAALPVSQELVSPRSELGAPTGVLSRAYDQAISADIVLLRIRIESCHSFASAIPAPSPVNPNDPAAYRPRTQWDNGPWRFDMTQNGKRMTADEFDAWMKARGVRVVPARPVQQAAAGTAPVPAGTAVPSQPQSQPAPTAPPTKP